MDFTWNYRKTPHKLQDFMTLLIDFTDNLTEGV